VVMSSDVAASSEMWLGTEHPSVVAWCSGDVSSQAQPARSTCALPTRQRTETYSTLQAL
jgi:hypothetical protein